MAGHSSRLTDFTMSEISGVVKSKTLIHSILSQITSHPRISLFISSILILQFLIVSIPRSLPFLPSPVEDKCASGRVYVYELPTMFNSDLVDTACGDLHPWRWQCGVATNGGYGRQATGLSGIVPESLAPAWHRTNQFSSEIIFHEKFLSYKCRTLEPESAVAFYIPFYSGLAVGKHLFSDSIESRDFLPEKLVVWAQSQPYWRRSNGSDHFLVLGRITWDFRRLTSRDKIWGSKFLNMPEMQPVTRLTIERDPGDYHDIGIPYPTGFHPRSLTEIHTWQNFVRTYNRTNLFTFVGAARDDSDGDIRGLLLRICRNESVCRLVDCALTPCANESSAIMESFLGSEFCLQPKGDSFTRRSVFDCILAGSVPVLFWNSTVYDQYELYFPGEPESYSVFIDHGDVLKGRKSIKAVLEKYSREDVRKMRERVIEMIPKIVYSEDGDEMTDAFEIAVDGVLRRFKAERYGRRPEGAGNVAGK